MAVAADYTNLVQTLYVSYFGRPADTFGLDNFRNQLVALNAPTTLDGLNAAAKTNAGIRALINSFSTSQEAADLYGTGDTVAFVSAIYQNLLNRTPDFDGLRFWVNAINSGSLSRADASLAIAAGASANTSDQGKLDAQLVANKIAVASAFTTAIDTGAELAGYSGNAAAAAARGLLANVTPTTTLTDFQDDVEASLANIVIASQPKTNSNLTIGIDTLPGTTANDTFNALNINSQTGAAANTLTGFDVIDGAAGTDTLNIYANATNNTTLANATVRNVEIINIINEATVAGDLFGTSAKGGDVDASKFAGATQVWQVGAAAADVVGLGNTTTAGFRGTTGQTLAVTAAAATANVALDQVIGGALNVLSLDIDGATVSSVNVSGSIVKAAGVDDAPTLDLGITAGKDVTTVTLNTGVATTVTLTEHVDTAAGKQISTLNAAASTGAITVSGDADLANIAAGAGNDTLALTAVLNGTVKVASVQGGAGNDTITVTGNHSGTGNTVAVGGGAGNDDITVAIDAEATYNITGGAGNDSIAITGTVKTADVVDGGEGTDTIELAGAAAYAADQYIVFNKVLKNFEGISFSSLAGNTTAIDASQLTGYKSFTFVADTVDPTLDNKITNVASDQSLSTSGDLDVQGTGWTATDKLGTATLNIAVTDDAVVTARASAVNLTATALSDEVAGAAGDLALGLAGSFATGTVTLVNGVAADDTLSVATLTVASTDIAVTTGLTVKGSGAAVITNVAASKLVNIDASGLASVDADGAAAAGLTLTSATTAAETIKLGAGIDDITLTASTYEKFDTVTGLKLVLDAAGTALDAAKTDSLTVNAAGTFVKFTTTQTDFALAVRDAAASTDQNVVFTFGGDTYVFSDTVNAGSNILDNGDTLVKLTGAVNLDALILSLAP